MKFHLQQPFVYLSDIRHNSLKAELINRLGIKNLISDRSFREEDPDLQRARERALWARGEIKRLLGLTITEWQSAIKIFSKLLKKLGYKLEPRMLGSRQERERVYYVANLHDTDRQSIIEALDRKYLDLLPVSTTHTAQNTHENVSIDTVSTTCTINTKQKVVDTGNS